LNLEARFNRLVKKPSLTFGFSQLNIKNCLSLQMGRIIIKSGLFLPEFSRFAAILRHQDAIAPMRCNNAPVSSSSASDSSDSRLKKSAMSKPEL